MGNPAWGAGYYQGSEDGFRTGFGQGAGTGAVATGVVGGLIVAANWGYKKFKKSRIAKHEQSLLEKDEPSGSLEDGFSDDDQSG
ncbi:hypothetical protein [Arthrobacter pigmenti]